MRVTRSDVTGRLDASKRTPQGGLKVPAYLTRTGVLTYRQPDGSVVRELRHPEDVFNEDSLASLAGAPITVGHPGKVTPDNYAVHSVGHVGDTVEQKEERFVAATLRVQGSKAVQDVEAGRLLELSCGYDCDSVPESGEFNGEKYDARQRNISYNHVALLPVNGGRAGNDVRIRFDGVAGEQETPTKLTGMDEKELAALKAERDAHKARADKAEGERDALAGEITSLKDPKRLDAAVERVVSLREDARTILGADAVFAGKEERTIVIEALTKVDSTFKADANVSLDYLRGRFDTAVASTRKGAASLDEVRKTVQDAQTAPTVDLVADAKARNDARSAAQWKGSK